MRVAIVENTRITHHGQVGVALHERAARIGLYRPWADQRLPDMAEYDALVVFGGEQAATDDHIHPYLPRLAGLMATAAEGGTAVLGICLGAQIMARGFGAENRLGGTREFGWCDVALTGTAAGDPVLAALPGRFPIFQWHSDTFTLPPGAELLATSPVAPVQCYRHGRAGYGMQFHFEVNRPMAADWLREFPDLIETISPGWGAGFAGHAATRGAAADQHGLAIARAWVGLI
jgi:GMP synthase-like glutamine amidotransferase